LFLKAPVHCLNKNLINAKELLARRSSGIPVVFGRRVTPRIAFPKGYAFIILNS
jgi:hypothetical protein